MYNYHRGGRVLHYAVEDQLTPAGAKKLKAGDEILVYHTNFLSNHARGLNLRTNKSEIYSMDKVRILAKTANYLSFM